MVMMQRRPAAVVSELFFSVSAEIRDEVSFSVQFCEIEIKNTAVIVFIRKTIPNTKHKIIKSY